MANKATKIQMNGQYEYSEIDKLGQGGYGSVYLGQSMLSSSRYAIKVVQINPSQEEALLKSITDEVGALSKVNHENIVKFIDLHVDQSQCRVYIVSEFCEGKTLKKFAEEHYHQHGHGLSEEDIDNILGQVVNAFCYLHSLNIHHRDIKPDNIMINAKGQIKLLDFGLAKQTSHLEDLQSTMKGTPQFMHPKLLIGELYRPQEVDMWALGVTIYFLYYLKYPFQADSGGHGFEVKLLKDMEDKLNSSIPFQDTEKRKISSKLKNLINSMLSKTNQITWEQLYQLYNVSPVHQTNTVGTCLLDTMRNEPSPLKTKLNHFISQVQFVAEVIKQQNVFHYSRLSQLQIIYDLKNMLYTLTPQINECYRTLLILQKKSSDPTNMDPVVFNGHLVFSNDEWKKLRDLKKTYQAFIRFVRSYDQNFTKLQEKGQFLTKDHRMLPPKFVFQSFKPILNDINSLEGLRATDLHLIDFLYNFIVISNPQFFLSIQEFNLLQFVKDKMAVSPYSLLSAVLDFYEENRF